MRLRDLFLIVLLLQIVVAPVAIAYSQQPSANESKQVQVRGVVRDSSSKPADGATVELKQVDGSGLIETKTDSAGVFSLLVSRSAGYVLVAKKAGLQSAATYLERLPAGKLADVELILGTAESKTSSTSPATAMQFADQPNFTVAGVTDFTAAGGHGSDSSLRTSEALARETTALKASDSLRGAGYGTGANAGQGETAQTETRLKAAVAKTPDGFESNHELGEFYFHAGRYGDAIPVLQSAYRIDPRNRGNGYDLALSCKSIGDLEHSRKYVSELLGHGESADLYRLAAELDEGLGDPLAAVREYQTAARLDASEENLFAWGSELLLHRAIWQAKQVFQQGVKAYPKSARMLTGLGTALFAGAAYDEAAMRLCEASDLNPSDSNAYVFMGKVQVAAPNPLGCIQEKLKRFLRDQPGNALANYLYAMTLLKSQSADAEVKQEAEALLKKTVAINSKSADAYLQLGILASGRHKLDEAIGYYRKAIEADPESGDAYYRLAVAYDRVGEAAKAKEEFQRHDEVVKIQAAAVEKQRQEIKQFLIEQPDPNRHPPTP